jgi:hypothetical protein
MYKLLWEIFTTLEETMHRIAFYFYKKEYLE